MTYDNEIEFKYQSLKKKKVSRHRYNKYSIASLILFGILYITGIFLNNIRVYLLFPIVALLIIFVYFNKRMNLYKFSLKESIIYNAQSFKNTINSKDYDLIQKNFFNLIEDLIDYDKYNDTDFYFDKNRKKVKEVLNYLKDYIYPTLSQKNIEDEYNIYTEENENKLQKILLFLDSFSLSLIKETFLDFKLDKDDLIHEETDLNSLKEHSSIFKFKNYILKLYDTSLPCRYIINFLAIFFIAYTINQLLSITNISNILTVSAMAAAGMTRSK